MAKCVYCGIDRKVSREHIFPDFLEKRSNKAGLYFTSAANKYVEGAPTVRDVCRVCNGGVLSRLDAYASKLFDLYFAHPIVSPVTFKCRRNEFCRWLLKVLFNGQRGFGGVSKPFLPYREYILGEGQPSRQILLFGAVMGPSRLNGQLIFPRDYRIGDLRLPELELGAEFELAHMLTLNSYSFCVISIFGGASEEQERRVIQYLENAFGVTLMDEAGTITFDPDSARMDHVSNKVRQAMHKPAQYGKNGYVEVGKKTYLMTALPAAATFPRSCYRDTKVALATIRTGDRTYAAAGLGYFPTWLAEVDEEFGATIQPSPLAYAKIERRSFKTYVSLVDPLELDAPHLKAVAGIVQSDENWLMWKEAIESNQLLYLCEWGNHREPVPTRIRCAVKAFFVGDS